MCFLSNNFDHSPRNIFAKYKGFFPARLPGDILVLQPSTCDTCGMSHNMARGELLINVHVAKTLNKFIANFPLDHANSGVKFKNVRLPPPSYASSHTFYIVNVGNGKSCQ